MITPAEIRTKAKRLYPKAVAAWIADEENALFPKRIPANLKLASELPATIRQVETLRSEAKEKRGFGYRIAWQERRDRRLGLNRFPEAIFLDSLDDLVRLINRQREFATLASAVTKLRHAQPELENWLRESTHWKDLLTVAPELDGLLAVVVYFQEHPRPDCFARELPLAISTKLVEQNRKVLTEWLDRLLPPDVIDFRYSHRQFEPRYGLRYVRPHFLLRILDPSLQRELELPFDELSLPAESLSQLPVRGARVFVVENKLNLLTLPSVARSLALGGLGHGVTQLADVHWLHETPIAYWGDLDVEGFEILSRLRQRFPHIRSLLMDQRTLDQFEHLAIPGNPVNREPPAHLTTEETEVCQSLIHRQLRLEQERVPQSEVIEAIKGPREIW